MILPRRQAPHAPGGGFIPLIGMERAHRQKIDFCDMLEAIADALPERVDRLQCIVVANCLVPLLRECHRFEEETVFPAFARISDDACIVLRLKAEHIEDECAAEDVSERLLAHGRGELIQNPEALGYMLRALFESMRRHIAFERDHVLPAIAGYGR